MTSSSEGSDHTSTGWVPLGVDERLPRSMVAYALDIRWGPFVDTRDQDEDPAYDQFITEFEGRWGPLTPATLARVARLRAPDTTTATAATALDAVSLPSLIGLEDTPPLHKMEVTDPFRRTEDELETLFLLEALGAAHPTLACEVLPSYLNSPRPRERWTSAMWLGRWKDRCALPYLLTMLCEFLPPIEVYVEEGVLAVHRERDYWYNDWRRFIPSLLALVPDAGLVVPLRQALLTMLRLERAVPRPRGPEVLRVAGKPPRFYYGLESPGVPEEMLPPDEPLSGAKQEEWVSLDEILREMLPPDEPLSGAKQEEWVSLLAWQTYHTKRRTWTAYQHRLVYGLGKLGAFGALLGIDLPAGVYHATAQWGSTSSRDWTGIALDNADAADHADQFRGYLWRVEAICGYLEAEYCAQFISNTVSFKQVPAFADAVAHLLAEQFGLTEAEQRLAMQDYERSWCLVETARHYEAVAQAMKSRGFDQDPVGDSLADEDGYELYE